MKILIILSLILVFLIVIVLALKKYRKREEHDMMCLPKFFQFNEKFDNYLKSDPMRVPFSDIAKDFDIPLVDSFFEANVIMFSDYTLYDQNFDKIPYKEKCNYKIFAINGIDLLANKKLLAERLENSGLIPKSFPLDNEEYKQELKNAHNENSIYIIKKNIQRQEGNLITKDINYILEKAWDDNYVVAQELLQNPLIVNKRKINMRIYLLIVIKNNLCDWYIYNNGFIYYTPQYFEKGSTEKDANITTGFIDRKVYETNPLTIKDLYNHLGKKDGDKLQKNIENAFYKLRQKYKNDFVQLNKNTPGLKFCIYGIDIAPDEDLNVLIIEANKGCSLDYKSKKDGQVKYNMVRDAFGLVGILPFKNEVEEDNFIQIAH